MRAIEVPLVVRRAYVIVLARAAVFAAALEPDVQPGWIGQCGRVVPNVCVLVTRLRVFIMPTERIGRNKAPNAFPK
jgi:hypothetical protein